MNQTTLSRNIRRLLLTSALMAIVPLTARAQYAYSNAVMALNPILYYPFNDTTNIPNDGFTNYGTAGTMGYMFDEYSAAYAPNHQGSAGPIVAEGNFVPHYNGTANFSVTPYSYNIDPSSVGGIPQNPHAPFTVEAWLNPDVATPAGTAVLSFAQSLVVPDTGWLLYQTGTNWEWRLFDGVNATGLPIATLDSASTPAPGTWDLVAMVWDGTNASLYVDGNLRAGPVAVTTFAPVNYFKLVRSGNFVTGPIVAAQNAIQSGTSVSTAWAGSVSDVAFYTNALSQSTLQSHYQNGSNAGSTPGSYETLVQSSHPLLFYTMNDPSLTTLGTAGTATTPNYGSLGSPANDGTYEPGTEVVPGIPFTGFGANHAAVNVSGIGYLSGIYTNSGIRIPPLVGINTNTFTYTGWIYERTPIQYADNFFWQRGSGDVGLWANNHNNPCVQLSTIWSGAPTNGVLADYGVAWPTNVMMATNGWNFVAAVWTPNDVTIYVNGTPSEYHTNIAVTTTGMSTHFNRDFSVGPMWLASDPGNTGIVGPWIMDEVAFFTNSLTAGQIQGLIEASQVVEAFGVTASPVAPYYEGASLTLTSTSFASTNQYARFWIKDGAVISGQSNATLVLSNVHTNDSGNYAIVVTNIYGAATSPPINLNIIGGPPFVVTQPVTNQLRYAGPTTAMTISVVPGGALPWSYQWNVATASSTNMIAGATNSSYTLTPIGLANNASTYTVSISNPHGTTTSSNVVLTVLSAPADFPALLMADGPTAYWPLAETSGSTAYDYAGGYNGTPIGGLITNNQPGPVLPGFPVSGISYLFPGSNTVANYVLTGLKGITGTSGTFVAMINANSSQVALASGAAPQVFAARNGSDVFALEPEFDAPTPSTAYVWANQSFTYGFNDNGVIPAQNAWSLIGVSVGPSGAIIFADGGTGLQMVTNSVNEGNMGVSGGAGPMQLGSDSAYTGTGNRNYNGYMAHAAFFNRTLSTAEIQALDQMAFQGSVAPVITGQSGSQTVYAGMPLNLTVDAAGGTPLTYQWRLNGVNIPGATGQNYSSASPYYTAAGVYDCVVTGSVGSPATSAPVQVTITPPPSFMNLTNGLVLHLKFDGDSLDSSGHTNNGVTNGAPTYVAGIIGSEAIHVGADDVNHLYNYVDITNNINVYPNDFDFGPANDFSVSFWVRFTGGTGANVVPNDIPFIGNAHNSTYNPGWVLTTDDGRPEISLVDFSNAGSDIDPAWSGPIISDGVWHHYAMSVDRNTNYVANIYIDGQLVYACQLLGWFSRSGSGGSVAGSYKALGDMTSGYDLVIGSDNTGTYGGNQSIGGMFDIDDMGLWTRALSSTEMQGIYLAGKLYGQTFDTYGPVYISAQSDGSNVDLIWEAGTLESAPSLSGPWNPVDGATSPFMQVPKAGANTFFRVHL